MTEPRTPPRRAEQAPPRLAPSTLGLRTRGGFIPVPIAALQLAPDRQFDLYAREVYDAHVRYVLFRSKRISMTPRALDRLVENHVRFLYIKTADHRQYTRYLESNLSAAMDNRRVADDQKTEILYATAVRLLEEIFSEPDDLGQVRRVLPIVDHIARRVLNQPRPFATLAAMNSHDHYTTTHLVNVSGYMSALAVAGGIGSPNELKEVALGGLLHDLGKICISPDLLNKPGRLRHDEWAAVAEHPVKSLTLASGYLQLSEAVCRTLVEHHERLDGEGYPRALPGDRIHTHAKIAAICDVFDSLTSHRTYRSIRSAQQALGQMESMAGDHLDPQWFRTWRDLVTGSLDARHWPPASCHPPAPDAAGSSPDESRAGQPAPQPDEGAPVEPKAGPAAMERRRFARRPFSIGVMVQEVTDNGMALQTRQPARAVDLSQSGIGLLSDTPIAKGTRLRIVPPRSARLARDLVGRVVRSVPDSGDRAYLTGLRFELTPARERAP